MPRELFSHKVNGLNESLRIDVSDEPGAGNACHVYDITNCGSGVHCHIEFQNGPIGESGVNGVSNEALLAVVEDRLTGFQSGQYACHENQMALNHLQEAMMWLQKRTLDRVRRGVEGTNVR